MAVLAAIAIIILSFALASFVIAIVTHNKNLLLVSLGLGILGVTLGMQVDSFNTNERLRSELQEKADPNSYYAQVRRCYEKGGVPIPSMSPDSALRRGWSCVKLDTVSTEAK